MLKFKKGFFCWIIVLFIMFPLSAQNVDSSLVGYYPFDGNADDSTSFMNHGSVSGATLTTDRCNVPLSAYEFDGIDDIIEVADNPQLQFGSSDFSISLWFYYDGDSLESCLVEKHDTTQEQYSIYFWNETDPGPSMGPSQKTLAFIQPENPTTQPEFRHVYSPVMDSGWHHLALVYENMAGLKYYVDSLLVGEDTNDLGTHSVSAVGYPLTIGNSMDGKFPFKGKIDELRIYNRTLSEKEIQLLAETVCLTNNELDLPPAILKVIPNPNHGRFNLHIDQLAPRFRGYIYTRIFDTSGREILQKEIPAQNGTHPFDLSYLSQGMYLLEVRAGEYSTTQRLVIE